MQQRTIKELETLEDMFQHPGWKLLKEDFQNILDNSLKNPDVECKTSDDWQFRRGCISELKYFLNYQTMVELILEESNASVF